MSALEIMLVVFYGIVATVVSEECTSTTFTGTSFKYSTISCELGCCGLSHKYCCVSPPIIIGIVIGCIAFIVTTVVSVLCILKKAGFRIPIFNNRVTGHTRVFMQHTNGPTPPQLVASAPPLYSSTADPTYSYANYSSPLYDSNLTAIQYPAPSAPAYDQAYP